MTSIADATPDTGDASQSALIEQALAAIRGIADPQGYVRIPLTAAPVPGIDTPPGYVEVNEWSRTLALAPAEVEAWLVGAARDPNSLYAEPAGPPAGYVAGAFDSAAHVTRRFLYHWWEEIQAILCRDDHLGKAAQAADLSAKTVATSLAVWLTGTFGIVSPVAVGLATVILLVLGQASRNALCRMTRDEVVQAVSARTQGG